MSTSSLSFAIIIASIVDGRHYESDDHSTVLDNVSVFTCPCSIHMKTPTIFALFLATVAFRLCYGSDVVELTDENFDRLVAQGTWMVKVFAPW